MKKALAVLKWLGIVAVISLVSVLLIKLDMDYKFGHIMILSTFYYVMGLLEYGFIFIHTFAYLENPGETWRN